MTTRELKSVNLKKYKVPLFCFSTQLQYLTCQMSGECLYKVSTFFLKKEKQKALLLTSIKEIRAVTLGNKTH